MLNKQHREDTETLLSLPVSRRQKARWDMPSRTPKWACTCFWLHPDMFWLLWWVTGTQCYICNVTGFHLNADTSDNFLNIQHTWMHPKHTVNHQQGCHRKSGHSANSSTTDKKNICNGWQVPGPGSSFETPESSSTPPFTPNRAGQYGRHDFSQTLWCFEL